MIKYISGDLFATIEGYTPATDEVVVIAHVCNNKGGWGAGFVVPLGRKYPKAQLSYRSLNGNLPLGHTNMVDVGNQTLVANMIAQDGYPTPQKPVAIDYPALEHAMNEAVDTLLEIGKKVTLFAPLFGVGLAGGDWKVVEPLILKCWINKGVQVNIFYLLDRLPPGWLPPVEPNKE